MPLQPQHAVDWLVETLMAADDDSITLCPLGPLTNIAMALVHEPRVAAKIREIVLMGGGFFMGGNTTPTSEFNIYVDPHAAHTVFSSGIKLTALPLDCTHKALMTDSWIQAVGAIGSKVGKAAAAMLAFYERYDMEKYGESGGPLHDPCVIAYLLKPDLFGGRDCHVAIETGSELTMGMTVLDWWGVTGKAANCTWIDRIDSDGFYALLLERLKRL